MFGYGRQRGRYRGRRWIGYFPEATYFRPDGSANMPLKTTFLSIEELEALRLVDLENLTQEEAAIRMGVSRKTLWNDLHRARKKVADALVNGRAIRIHGFGAVDPNFPFAPTYHMREISSHNLDGVAERQILQLLPARNCGMCGYSTCAECARAMVLGNAPYDACKVADNEINDKIKEILERR